MLGHIYYYTVLLLLCYVSVHSFVDDLVMGRLTIINVACCQGAKDDSTKGVLMLVRDKAASTY